MQSWHDYLWMGDYDATSTSTTTPKNDLQKLLSSHYDDTQVSGHISRTPTIALEALPRLPLVGGLMKNINTYNSTKGHPTEARQSSSGMTFQFKPNDVQASGSRSTSLSHATRGQGNQYIIYDDSKGRRYVTTSTTTQELTPSKVLESFGKAFQPYKRSPASIKVLNHNTITHCRHVPKETKIHITSGVSNPPREGTLPRDENSILASTHNYEAPVPGDLNSTLRLPYGRSNKSQIDRGAHHAKKSTSRPGTQTTHLSPRLWCAL